MALTFKSDDLLSFGIHLFEAKKVPATVARRVSDSLVSTSLAGIDSHGVILFIRYIDEIENGQIVPDAEPEIVTDSGPVSLIDGHFGFGQVTAMKGMALAIDKASSHGIAAVGFRHTNHIGRVGEYTLQAARKNLIALGSCNAGANVAPYGASRRLFGTNPLCCAIPVRDRDPILIDLATSILPEGKIRVAKNEKRKIKPGILIDREGKPTDIPADLYLGGAILPIGEHKGSALSLMVEVLCGLMTGTGCAAFSDWPGGNGVLFIVIDPSRFRNLNEFFDDIDKMIGAIKGLPTAPGCDEILLPGDPEYHMENERKKNGIPLDDETWQGLQAIAERLGVATPEPLNDARG
ncbi:MAG: Ldh family oxidoreductase [Deltaproteobacteria bacterium]|nr:Ldh family oxidoreductase [Deltaproteobacteria bacterium]